MKTEKMLLLGAAVLGGAYLAWRYKKKKDAAATVASNTSNTPYGSGGGGSMIINSIYGTVDKTLSGDGISNLTSSSSGSHTIPIIKGGVIHGVIPPLQINEIPVSTAGGGTNTPTIPIPPLNTTDNFSGKSISKWF